MKEIKKGKRGKIAKTDPTNALRIKQMTEMRVAGATLEQIGERFGISRQRVHAICKKITEDACDYSAEKMAEHKAMQVARLERLRVSWWQKALTGDEKAAAVVLKCLDQLARIEGTEAAIKSQVTGADGQPLFPADAIRDELLRKIKGE
jgi:hypothetical protein